MTRTMINRVVPSALAAVLVTAVLGFQPAAAGARDASTCDPQGNEPAYALGSRALTGPDGAELSLRVTGVASGCTSPETLKKVQLKVFALDGTLVRTRNLNDVASPDGAAAVELGRVARGQHVSAEVLVEPDATRTYVLRDETKALLRPDLVAAHVDAPAQVLGGRQFEVAAKIAERNGDVGATATVTLNAGTTVLGGPSSVTVSAGGSTTITFPVTLQTPGATTLDVQIRDSEPGETDSTNNDGHATLEVTEFELEPSQVIVPSIAGYGGQFNHHVYSALSRAVGVTDENVGEMEQKMVALQPQFSRIFFNPSAFTDPDKMQSFVRTVLLAQTAGTTINITWQGGALTDGVNGTIRKFANVLIDLVQNRGVSNLRWVTLQNEPNSTSITPPQYEAFYRNLDKYLLSIRGQVRYMGGDLVQTDQQVWFDYMATHMSDLLDAWSIHVFWDYWDTAKLQARLQEVRDIWDAEPGDERKPLYVAEYGVRGLQTFNGVTQIKPGVWSDGTPMTKTNISAFQHAWFDILSARLGYLGTSKWDSYFGKYDNGTQAFYMIGPPQEGWPLYPIYNTVHLWTSTVTPGWSVVRLDGSSGSKLLAGYVGGDGQRTVLGLDTSGAQLNTVAATSIGYSIGGLPASTPFHLAIWNADGDGKNAPPQEVTTDAAGVVTVSVPLQSVFALTTVPVHFG